MALVLHVWHTYIARFCVTILRIKHDHFGNSFVLTTTLKSGAIYIDISSTVIVNIFNIAIGITCAFGCSIKYTGT